MKYAPAVILVLLFWPLIGLSRQQNRLDRLTGGLELEGPPKRPEYTFTRLRYSSYGWRQMWTTDFYRWRVTLPQAELQALLRKKLGLDFGQILRLEPVERAESGRLVKLRIVGEKETLVIGKELEIRRALSPSHLYSSAFVVEGEPGGTPAPRAFTLVGAGWGHGVGLCQIGAALMAERGYAAGRILEHYYPGARLHALYSAES